MGVTLPPCLFSLNNLERIKAVTLAIFSNKQHFIRNIHAKFCIPNLIQSPDIAQNLDRGISNFRISCQASINENCHDSITSNVIDMKLDKRTKIGRRNTSRSNNLKNADINKTKGVLVLKSMFSKTTYMCVLTYQISNF